VALDAAGMGTFVWYVRQDYAASDARMLELFGLPPDGVLSLAAALSSMIHPEDRQRYEQAVLAALDPAGKRELRQEIRVARDDGSYRWVAVTARASFAGDPPVAERLIGVAADVTERVDERRRADELVRAEQTRARDEEHHIAVELQRALLPRSTVTRPDVAIAARYEAGSATLEVGGDWYDTFELPDGRIGLTVGDVVGHGLTAATAMGKLRVAMGALAPHADGPGRLLSYLDGFAAGSDGVDFATACYGIFDPRTGELRHASAGHPPMLVVTADGQSRLLMAGRSAPITGKPAGVRPDATEILEPGSVLLLYSDGLIERRREVITAGLERLEHAAVELRDATVKELCDGLLTALGVAEHRDDDVVVLCLRVPARPAVAFQQTISAEPTELSRLRRLLSAWRRTIQPADRGESDLLLAINEACANAVEHAYADGPRGTIEVTVGHEPDGSYLATVRDFGRWRPPAGASSVRGRGLAIIRDLTHGFERHSTGEGTVITFRLPAMGATR